MHWLKSSRLEREGCGIRSALGTPLKPTWLPSGGINVNNASGHADLALGLMGSMHRGTIYVVADRSDGI